MGFALMAMYQGIHSGSRLSHALFFTIFLIFYYICGLHAWETIARAGYIYADIDSLSTFWSEVGFGGYRPIAFSYSVFMYRIYDAFGYQVSLAVMLIISAILTYPLYLLYRKYLSPFLTLSFIVIFYCSQFFLLQIWEMTTFNHMLVVGPICLGLLLVSDGNDGERDRESGDHRAAVILRYGVLTALLIALPWIREYGVVLAAALSVVAVVRRNFVLGVIAVAGLVHGLFPTLLVAPFHGELPVSIVFALGNVQTVTGVQETSLTELTTRMFSELTMRGGWALVALFAATPSALVLATTMRSVWTLVGAVCGAILVGGIAHALGAELAISYAMAALLTVTSQYLVMLSIRPRRDHLLVGIVTMLSFLPFLRLYAMPVHLMYVLPFLLLSIGIVIEGGGVRSLRRLALILVGLTALLQLPQAWASASIIRATIGVSGRAAVGMAPGSTLVSIVPDLGRFAEDRPAGPDVQVIVVPQEFGPSVRYERAAKELETALRAGRAAYLLDTACGRMRGTLAATTRLVFTLRPLDGAGPVRYPVHDPLLSWLMPDHLPFLGMADAENGYRCALLSDTPMITFDPGLTLWRVERPEP